MELVALQEFRWRGKGKINKASYSLYFSGTENRQGDYGVDFLITKNARKSEVTEKEAVDQFYTELQSTIEKTQLLY